MLAEMLERISYSNRCLKKLKGSGIQGYIDENKNFKGLKT